MILCCGSDKQGNLPTWQKDAVPIEVDKSRQMFMTNMWALMVVAMQYDDKGTYQCITDTVSYTTTLTVEGMSIYYTMCGGVLLIQNCIIHVGRPSPMPVI